MRVGGKEVKNRVLSEKNRYYLPKEEFLTVLHFSQQYPNWVQELRTEPDTSKAITYDEERVQTSGGYDACSEAAMRRYALAKKKQLVEDTVREVAPEIYEYRDHWGRLCVSPGAYLMQRWAA